MIVLLNKENEIFEEYLKSLLLENFKDYFDFSKRIFTEDTFNEGIKLIEQKYLFMYWLKSKTKAFNIYNDDDGDFLKADTDTDYFDNPIKEIEDCLKEHKFSEVQIRSIILSCDENEHFENLYYGESETYGYIKILLEWKTILLYN